VAYHTSLQQKSGIEGSSLFFAPNPAIRLANPNLTDSWDMRPSAAQYNTMHLVLLNVVSHLWKLLAGLKLVQRRRQHHAKGPCRTGGAGAAQRTADRAARTTQVLTKYRRAPQFTYGSRLDAFHLCAGEVRFAGRIPGESYDIFMALSRASRLLFRPRGVSEAEIKLTDNDLKYFVGNYYAMIYRGSVDRRPLCLSTFSALLDVVSFLRACGPAWFCWQC